MVVGGGRKWIIGEKRKTEDVGKWKKGEKKALKRLKNASLRVKNSKKKKISPPRGISSGKKRWGGGN